MGKRSEQYRKEVDRRILAVQICIEGGGSAKVRRAVARAYGVDERTVRRWEQRIREGKPVYESPGRPPEEVPRTRRQQVIKAFVRLGPCAGVPVLRGLFPDVPYRFLAKQKRRYVRALQRRKGWRQRKPSWLKAGTAWAADFTKPKAGLWGGKRRLLLVRDLASGATLAAVACRGEKARVVRTVFLALFTIFGAPLILKHDLGGAFIANDTKAMLGQHRVTALPSPARTPEYNGSCERAGGTFKLRTEHIASLAGHARQWRPHNIDEALLIANTTARPWGANGPTPSEALEARVPLTDQARAAFKQTRADAIARGLKTFKERNGRMPTCWQRAAIDRKATQHALCKHGYLEFRRGRLSTPISTWRADVKA